MIIVPSNHTKIEAWVNRKMSGRNPPLYYSYCTKYIDHYAGTPNEYEDERHDKLGLQLNLLLVVHTYMNQSPR